ncbi:hypothetical protein AVEN_231475-1 [Araneus ventricosus]|uniref:HTH psq-type domain-containing protein n=1 Tax=Araneus ventricosus TaxID=182803 RepID=A0A4Y2S2M7_ARAVE|nr:hypothetical protein AVEN_231475-1 [Araneus ventricosus]
MSPSSVTIPIAGSADIVSLSPPIPSCRKFHSIVPLCRKFHSSPRPSAFCLSTGYFLYVLEALTLLKYRKLIYPMEPTKRKLVFLTVEQKFQIVSRIEAGTTLTKLLKEFGVGLSTVGDMRSDSEKNKRFYAASNGKSTKLRKTMKCVNDEELDNVLYKWFV